jgi:hypothetical protein
LSTPGWFPQTQVGAWNVDKRAPNTSHFEMVRCLYSEDGVVIGQHSEFYAGQPTRGIASTEFDREQARSRRKACGRPLPALMLVIT